MSVIMTNTLRFGVLHGLGALVMVFAKLFITSSVCVASYFILRDKYNIGTRDDQLQGLSGPMIIIFVFSLIVAELFTYIWETSCDVILHCYCIDDAIQTKKGGSTKHASEKLTATLNEAERRNTMRNGGGQAQLQDNLNYN